MPLAYTQRGKGGGGFTCHSRIYWGGVVKGWCTSPFKKGFSQFSCLKIYIQYIQVYTSLMCIFNMYNPPICIDLRKASEDIFLI